HRKCRASNLGVITRSCPDYGILLPGTEGGPRLRGTAQPVAHGSSGGYAWRRGPLTHEQLTQAFRGGSTRGWFLSESAGAGPDGRPSRVLVFVPAKGDPDPGSAQDPPGTWRIVGPPPEQE